MNINLKIYQSFYYFDKLFHHHIKADYVDDYDVLDEDLTVSAEDDDDVSDDADRVERMVMLRIKLIMMTFLLNMSVVMKTWLFLSIMSK